MIRTIFIINMQSQSSLNTTRLSMALVDLPLTPIGMKNTSKKKSNLPSGKENRLCNPSPLQRKFRGEAENICTIPELEISTRYSSTSDSESRNGRRTRDSVYTQIDDGSFVEFYVPKPIPLADSQKQLYYSCLTNTDTDNSTSSKKSTALVGFRQYVEAFKNQHKLSNKLEDDTIISDVIGNNGRPAPVPNYVLNSTAKNGSFWNFDFPDISALTISSRPSTINEDRSVIILDDSNEQIPIRAIPKRAKAPQHIPIIEEVIDSSLLTDCSFDPPLPRNQNKLLPPVNSFIAEDASICSSNIGEPCHDEPCQITNDITESSDLITASPESPKRDVREWIISSPFKTAQSDSSLGQSVGISGEKYSQNLHLRLSGSSLGSSENNNHSCMGEKADTLLTVGRDAISPRSASEKPTCLDKVDRPPQAKTSPVIIVPDSDDQSSDCDDFFRPPSNRLATVISSSSSSDASPNVVEANNLSHKLSRKKITFDSINNTEGVNLRISLSDEVPFNLRTLQSPNQSSRDQRPSLNSSPDSSSRSCEESQAIAEDLSEIVTGRKCWRRNRCISSSDDESIDAPGPSNSKVIEILSSSAESSNDASVQEISDSDSENNPDTFSDLRKKLHSLIKTKEISSENPIAPKKSPRIPGTSLNPPLLPYKTLKTPLTSRHLNRTPLTSRGHIETPGSNRRNDDTFNTSSSDDDCFFVRKKSQTRKLTKPGNQSRSVEQFKSLSADQPLTQRISPFETTKMSFLSSLSRAATDPNLHPDAKPFLKNFNKIKSELTNHLYAYFNKHVFQSTLPPGMNIKWNQRMRKTAGFCYYQIHKSSPTGRDARIELSSKVIDSADRLRDTLIHEMCHAASWIVSGYKCGHGPLWKSWVFKAMKTFPELPCISRCHSYSIACKYTYECTKCGYSIGRHSKSLDVEKKVCGRCYGTFKLLLTSDLDPSSTPKTPRNAGPFAIFVKENYSSVKKDSRHESHGDVMKELSKQFKTMKLPKPTAD